ncbi:MAG TPA: M1 family peptidase, partial [Saprospiraceae bacterium]|nr:M1 family peptidase [Saprospiraceae bacterium]
GLELDWYLDYWVYSTHTIDYIVAAVEADRSKSSIIRLHRKGAMPMPVDVEITLNDGQTMRYHIPLCMMRGGKPSDSGWDGFEKTEAWPWVEPYYQWPVPVRHKDIAKVVIDPTGRMADVNRANNEWKP